MKKTHCIVGQFILHEQNTNTIGSKGKKKKVEFLIIVLKTGQVIFIIISKLI